MGVILCIETATKTCSVALSVNGKCEFLEEIREEGYSHAEKLHPSIETILRKSEYSLQDIDAIAVSKGPGSYTGLRIGVSAAKGLAFSLNIPLISIGTLDSMALNQIKKNKGFDFYVPMLDARRMEVYTLIYNNNSDLLEKVNAKVLESNSLDSVLDKGKVVIFGDGAAKFKDVCDNQNLVLLDDVHPSSGDMCELAEEKFKNSEFESIAYFEPFYLKDFVTTKSTKRLL